MTILPSVYWGSIEWYAHIMQRECVLDLGENYVKRSERNRTRIMTAGGTMLLSVQLEHADRPRQPIRDMRIDYSKRWQHQHWGALVASYKASPYFDHYAPALEPFYRREGAFATLAEWNLALVETLCGLLRMPAPALSERYVEAAAGDVDLRPRHSEGPAFRAEPYVQVFCDRQPFAANLSVIDLLFAEGPAAVSILRRSLP